MQILKWISNARGDAVVAIFKRTNEENAVEVKFQWNGIYLENTILFTIIQSNLLGICPVAHQ